MKDKELNSALTADAGLDEALAQMAEEVPPMPADFHERWMSAVRAEAEKTGNAAPAEPAPGKIVSLAHWTRILSVAAVFVFLIGGTLLYRNSKKSLSVPDAAEMREAAEAAVPAAPEAAEAPAAGAEDGFADMEIAAEDTAAEAPVVYESYMQSAAVNEAAETGGADYSEAAAMKAAGNALNVFAASDKAEEACDEAEEAAYDAEPAADEAAAVPAATMAPTAAPTPEMTAAPAPAEESEPAEGDSFLQAAGAFFTDMGDFLLAALPYLLVLAVPAVTALILRRKKSRRS